MKKTILVDLDGVLNEYTGDYNMNFIPPIKEGALEFIKQLSKNYIVKIFTARNHLHTAKWLIENNLDEYIADITSMKEASILYIDDRCINFRGDYLEIAEKIKNFEPWYR